MNLLRSKRLRSWSLQLLLFVVCWYSISAWQQRGLIADAQPAPDFRLTSLTGDAVQLSKIESDKTLLYFFAPWCSICKLSIANLDQLQGSSTTVLAVALAYDSPQAVADFIAEQQLQTPVLLGDSELQQAYRIEMFPTYYVLDHNKRVTSRSVGYSSEFGLKARTL